MHAYIRSYHRTHIVTIRERRIIKLRDAYSGRPRGSGSPSAGGTAAGSPAAGNSDHRAQRQRHTPQAELPLIGQHSDTCSQFIHGLGNGEDLGTRSVI